ncbi:MAG: hypothetical protein RDU24_09065 [Humidesulfovibrio sp.]|uniref:hypothetical protein n=1 Tax=Humidesulfovibrio sp. TaxID=2910988 RepID=UPI0027F139DB|nr:hypothetical protein [Humidesulfovibrio sp.]MDQ7835517.1 hypothetical protein [Humidesulfovibrio sp.]
MTTVIPQCELTKRAIDWICEQNIPLDSPAARKKAIEEAAMRFNLGPLEEEFLERFFKGDATVE